MAAGFAFLAFCCCCCCCLATIAFAVGDSVKLQFYQLQLQQWTSGSLEAKLRASVAAGLESFCAAQLSECGMNSSTDANFTDANVLVSGAANVNSRYMSLQLSVRYHLHGGLLHNMSAARTAAIVASERQSIQNSVGYYLVYIDSSFYSVPPPMVLNSVIVSVSVAFTVALVAAALLLRHHRSSQLVKKGLHAKEEFRKRNCPAASTSADHSETRLMPADDPDHEQQQQQEAKAELSAAGTSGQLNGGYEKSTSEFEMQRKYSREELSSASMIQVQQQQQLEQQQQEQVGGQGLGDAAGDANESVAAVEQ